MNSRVWTKEPTWTLNFLWYAESDYLFMMHILWTPCRVKSKVVVSFNFKPILMFVIISFKVYFCLGLRGPNNKNPEYLTVLTSENWLRKLFRFSTFILTIHNSTKSCNWKSFNGCIFICFIKNPFNLSQNKD